MSGVDTGDEGEVEREVRERCPVSLPVILLF